ncbi:hypothetical protein GCM10023215_61810 [Pseudonocardia yuanmonensis]|uniref:Ketoreductase domain-containing protein n=1 Tax=Pseudonocardia yuanmonensis TaxID=1095914 RepID=A0ABP8XMI0_9PSEU
MSPESTSTAKKLDFSGRRALVTGAASGIGRATARWLDEAGVAGLILVDVDAAGLAAVDLSCEVRRVVGDVGDTGLWERIEAETSRLDHAVLNAGVPPAGLSVADTSAEQWRRVLGTNLDGAFHGLRCALRLMRGRGGSIVLTSSVAGIRPMEGTADYGAAKAALIQLAKVAALENAADGIRVNTVVPGSVNSGIREAGRDAAEIGVEPRIRVPGRPADELAAEIGFWIDHGASHLSFSTMDAGLRSVAEHLRHLESALSTVSRGG